MDAIKTEWDLTLLYKSISDPQIEKDIVIAENLYSKFEKKYKKNPSYMKNENALFTALKDLEKVDDFPIGKTIYYFHLLSDKDSRNEAVKSKMNVLIQRLQKMGNSLIFFGVNLSKIEPKYQKKFLKSKKLSHYRYMLLKIFESGKYILSEPEEKILSLKSLPSHGLWVKALENIRTKQTVEYEGNKIPIAQAEMMLKELPSQEVRLALQDKIMAAAMDISSVAESELNAIVIDKKIEDELRGYKEPYDATILSYENDRKSVLNLVGIVTQNFHVSQRFYKVKAKILGLKKLKYSDRAANVGKTNKKVTFKEAYTVLDKLFTSINPRFGEILRDYVREGRIDVYPSLGKTSGAYSSHEHKTPGFVLLNHTDDFHSMMTFAHEMGHAIHSEYSAIQPVFYEGYSMSTAEVASTLFEQFLFYDQFKKLNNEEKVVALHDKIQDDVASIFRQIACFNFEVEMHKTIREKGNMSHQELAGLMNKHMGAYLGDIMDLREKDGYGFVGWSHLRRFFYVYSYGFGQLASKALYEKYSQDNSYIRKIEKFLSSGSSMSPEDIFKSIGVDMTKPDFWKEGIKNIEKDVILLESLVSKK